MKKETDYEKSTDYSIASFCFIMFCIKQHICQKIYDVCSYCVFFSRATSTFRKNEDELFKVGQGDAILIILPNGQTVLIDGGPYEAGEIIIQKLVEKGINHLDVVVGTHPDMDHIGGLIPIIEQMPVSLVLDSGKTYSSFTYHTYRNNIKKRGIPFVRVKQGQHIPLDPQVAIQVLNNGESKDENNESSIVLKVRYGKADFC